MPICISCGTKSDDTQNMCPSCGQALDPRPVRPKLRPQQAEREQQLLKQGYLSPGLGGASRIGIDEKDNKTMACLAYILFLIPIITGDIKRSDFVKYHTNQGLLVAILLAAYTIIYRAIAAFMHYAVDYAAYRAVSIILWFLYLAPLAFMAIGILHASGGKWKPLPLIGNLYEFIK